MIAICYLRDRDSNAGDVCVVDSITKVKSIWIMICDFVVEKFALKLK